MGMKEDMLMVQILLAKESAALALKINSQLQTDKDGRSADNKVRYVGISEFMKK